MELHIVQVQVKKTVKSKTGERELIVLNENGSNGAQLAKGLRAPTIRRSKLLIVDLAGSERVDKSGRFLESVAPFSHHIEALAEVPLHSSFPHI